MQSILKTQEAQKVFENMEDETSSLLCIADNASTASRRTKMSETSVGLDTSFPFDVEILGSKVYAVTYRSHLRQAIASGKVKPHILSEGAQKRPATVNGLPTSTTVSSDQCSGGETASIQSTTLGDGHQSFYSLSTGNRTDMSQRREIPTDGASTDYDTSSMTHSWGEQEQNPHQIDKRYKRSGTTNALSSILRHIPYTRLHNPASTLGHVRMAKCRIELSEFNRLMTKSNSLADSALKVLFLGVSDSVTSTLCRALRIFHNGPNDMGERGSVSEVVFTRACQSVRTVLRAMEASNIVLGTKKNVEHAELLQMQPTILTFMPPIVHKAIESLSQDSGFQEGLKLWEGLHLPESVDL